MLASWLRSCPRRSLRPIPTAARCKLLSVESSSTLGAGRRSRARRRRRCRRLTLAMRFPDRLIRQTTPTRGRCDETRETARLRQVDSPGICTPYDFPKNMHYPVGCYRDGGENADGAEPAGGRAKQHLSETTDTKTECRNAYPRIPDPGRGREADRRLQSGAPRPPRRYADPGCF